MKNNSVFFLLLIILPIPGVFCQETQNDWMIFIHIESGLMYPNSKIRKSIPIRQNVSSYIVDQVSYGEISSETNGYLFGVRYGYFNDKFRAGISSGLRYTNFNTEIKGYSSYGTDFYYLRYSMVGSDTKFARVRTISETNNFISVPVELRYVPIQFEKIGFYVKAGAEFSYFNIQSKTDIDFREESMEEYQDEILNNITAPTNRFYSTLYGSFGIVYGKEGRPKVMFDFSVPSRFLGKNNFALTKADYFQAFTLSLQIPISPIK
ncbi:MAG TPA: hypothetical protein VE870_05985 [Bacteroidales bacterium]|nr:hypothetical protein [Bacteroidales bacterium]